MTPSEYWKANSTLNHITPAGIEFPEVNLLPTLQKVCTGSVFEFGCGYGRLAPAFTPSNYYGMDINETAIVEARKRNPDYRFGDVWSPADTCLAYTVMLHIPDYELDDVVSRLLNYKRVVIGEIMGRQWRRPGNPPVFNREPEEYAEIMGGEPTQTEYVYYPRYKTDLTILVFDND